jgi:D-sedoheptulose 7-phosphate isomerase
MPRSVVTGGATLGETVRFDACGYLQGLAAVVQRLDVACLARMAEAVYATLRSDGTIYTMGNGGSAAVAIHLATDLARLTRLPERDRQLRVVALNVNPSVVTACANDFGFENVFVEQLRGVVRPGDVVVGISTSGASPNVVRGIEHGRAQGAAGLAMTGTTGAPLLAVANETLVVPSADVQVIEDAAMVAAHLLCLLTYQRRLDLGD